MSYYSCNNNRNSCGCNSCSGVLGTNSCTYSDRSCGNIAGQQTGNCGCGHKHYYPFPPMSSVYGTCPPGTRPCHYNMCGCNNVCGCNNMCGCNNNCGCNNCANNGGCGNDSGNAGTYAFFNSTGSTLTTGSIIPLRYVIGSGELGRGTTGGTVSLDAGVYSVEYSLNATSDIAGSTITITPEYLGALHPEYSRSFTTTAADQTFDFAGSFVVNLPTDTTLSLNVTTTEPEDATTATTLSGVNASMLIRRISGCNNN
ncbi:MAG: hypothetical protein J6E38_09530 [Clostridia bacterium]|nr:hypothetical protein [Clostridia bacterium]